MAHRQQTTDNRTRDAKRNRKPLTIKRRTERKVKGQVRSW